MRDSDLLISLLKEIEQREEGYILLVKAMGMDRKKRHHAHLLVDAGHAVWDDLEEQRLRITMDGYDFLNAIERQSAARERFNSVIEKGLSYIEAAAAAIELAKSFGG